MALKNAEITRQDFAKISPKKGDFVYFDPPYYPLNATSFTGYTMGNFFGNDQIRLWEFARTLDRNGVFWMISNSDTPLIRTLFKTFKIETIRAPRNVNCKAHKRGAINELLISNF